MDINDIKEGYQNKLRNRLFGLLREFERDREWEKYLDSILIELMGYSEEEKTINYYILIYKLNSLRYLKHQWFRTTIFDCMNLIGK